MTPCPDHPQWLHDRADCPLCVASRPTETDPARATRLLADVNTALIGAGAGWIIGIDATGQIVAVRASTAFSPCREYRPDHNGECLNCDEPFDAHTPAARGES